MKIKINDQYMDLPFWSYFKYHFLGWLVMTVFMYGGLVVVGILSEVFGW